jgi:hypothetical protein
MLLAKKKNHLDKLEQYKKNLEHLAMALNEKKIDSQIKKMDIEHMKKKLQILRNKIKLIDDYVYEEKQWKQYNEDNYDLDSTYYGLYKWSAYKFKKLGWMIIDDDCEHSCIKRVAYIKGLKRLKKSLIYMKDKIMKVTDTDKNDYIQDLDIMINDIKYLKCFVWKNLIENCTGCQSCMDCYGQTQENLKYKYLKYKNKYLSGKF